MRPALMILNLGWMLNLVSVWMEPVYIMFRAVIAVSVEETMMIVIPVIGESCGVIFIRMKWRKNALHLVTNLMTPQSVLIKGIICNSRHFWVGMCRWENEN